MRGVNRLMQFILFWTDIYIVDKFFGLGILTFRSENSHRSLLSIYYSGGECLIDIFWIH